MSLNKINNNSKIRMPKIPMGVLNECSNIYSYVGSLSRNIVEKNIIAKEDYLINPTLFKKKEGGYFIIYVTSTVFNDDSNIKEWFTFTTSPKEIHYFISKLKPVYEFNVLSLFTFARKYNNIIPTKYFKNKYKHENLLNILSDKAFFHGKNKKTAKIPIDDKTVDKIFNIFVDILNYKRPKKFDKLIETEIKIKKNIDNYNYDNEEINFDDNNIHNDNEILNNIIENDYRSDDSNNDDYEIDYVGDEYGNIDSYNDNNVNSNSDTVEDIVHYIDKDNHNDNNSKYENTNLNKYLHHSDGIFIKLKNKHSDNNTTKRKLDKDKIESNSKKKKSDNFDGSNLSKHRFILLLNECKEKIEKTTQKTKDVVQTIIDEFKEEIGNMFLSIGEFKDKNNWEKNSFFAEVLVPILYILTCQLDESFYGFVYDFKSFEKISNTNLIIEATDLSEWSSIYRKKVKIKENLIMKETLDYLNYDGQVDEISKEDEYPIVEFFILWTKWINQFVFFEVLEKTLLSAEYNKYGLFDIECSIMKEQKIIDESTWTEVMKTQKIDIDGNSTNFIFLVLAIEQLLKEKFNKMKGIEEKQIEDEEIIDIWNPNIDF